MTKKKKPINNQVHEEVDYWDKLDEDQVKFLQQFNSEYKDGGSYYTDTPILNTPELIQEATRNHHNLTRDAFEVAGRQGSLVDLDEVDKQFMEDASDEWAWRDAYKVGGYELACNFLFAQAIKKLTDETEWEVILANFYVKMNNLRLYRQRIKYHSRKKKKRD